tara:strand:- start:1487 stop:2002 length:516 start_codon:yes stop_codon:yes gene_type:complete
MAVESTIRSIGVIGTPGCGKTTFCQQSNLPVIDMTDYAREHGCLGEVEDDGAAEMDVEMLSKMWRSPDNLTLVDGHLAHHLPVDAILILRCNLDELSKRLESRGYSAKKVRDNYEVELMGGPWIDGLVGDKRPIYETVSSDLGFKNAIEWINSGCPPHTTARTALDWISQE